MTDGREEGVRKRSLSERIAGQYSLYLLRTMALMLLVFTLVYWITAIIYANSLCSAALERLEVSQWQAGSYIISDTGLERIEDDAVYLSLMPQRLGGALVLSRERGSFTAVLSMSNYAVLYVALILTLTAVELVRLRIMRRRAGQISRKALQPISEIVTTAKGMSASRLSERIAADGARDEMRELIDVLNEMLTRIELAYNNQKQFVSDASHELRTPISVIQGYADMLDRWGKADPEVRDEAIAAIRVESRAMKDLVEQLLFIARHENANHRYEMEFFDLGDMAQETLRETRLIAGRHQVDMKSVQSVLVHGDRGALKQALRIFLDNALKYTAADGTVSLSCVREGSWARLSVEDNGVGIAREDLRRVFDRFYRTPDARGGDVDGHGLGLSIARMIVQAHGGRIEVQSRPGVGSRFHILLPV